MFTSNDYIVSVYCPSKKILGSWTVAKLTPTLQKSRMPQILGVEGEAVVLYREPSTTQEMRYPRLSRRVNKHSIKNNEIACICSFLAYVAILFMQLRG